MARTPASGCFEFTAGVFLVYLLGGAAIALGPGQLLLSLVPRPDHEDRAVLEIIAGVAMLIAAFVLWRHRDRLSTPADEADQRPTEVERAARRDDHRDRAADRVPVLRRDRGDRRLGLRTPRQVFLLVAVQRLLRAAAGRDRGAADVLARPRAGALLGTRLAPGAVAGVRRVAVLAGLFVILLGTAYLADSRFSQLLRHFPPFLHP